MSSHSRARLESWVAAFRGSHPGLVAEIQVLVQDSTEGDDPGLIEVKLANATTTTVIEPKYRGSPRWVVVFEAREMELRLECDDVSALAGELLVVSQLCAFLEAQARVAGTILG